MQNGLNIHKLGQLNTCTQQSEVLKWCFYCCHWEIQFGLKYCLNSILYFSFFFLFSVSIFSFFIFEHCRLHFRPLFCFIPSCFLFLNFPSAVTWTTYFIPFSFLLHCLSSSQLFNSHTNSNNNSICLPVFSIHWKWTKKNFRPQYGYQKCTQVRLQMHRNCWIYIVCVQESIGFKAKTNVLNG